MYAQPPITSHNAYTTSCIALCYSYTEPQSRGHPQNRPLNAKVPKSLERSALPSVVSRVGRGLQPRLLFLQLKSDGLSRRFSICVGRAREGFFGCLLCLGMFPRDWCCRATQGATRRLLAISASCVAYSKTMAEPAHNRFALLLELLCDITPGIVRRRSAHSRRKRIFLLSLLGRTGA